MTNGQHVIPRSRIMALKTKVLLYSILYCQLPTKFGHMLCVGLQTIHGKKTVWVLERDGCKAVASYNSVASYSRIKEYKQRKWIVAHWYYSQEHLNLAFHPQSRSHSGNWRDKHASQICDHGHSSMLCSSCQHSILISHE